MEWIFIKSNYMLLIRETLQILGHRKAENTKMKNTSYNKKGQQIQLYSYFFKKSLKQETEGLK